MLWPCRSAAWFFHGGEAAESVKPVVSVDTLVAADADTSSKAIMQTIERTARMIAYSVMTLAESSTKNANAALCKDAIGKGDGFLGTE